MEWFKNMAKNYFKIPIIITLTMLVSSCSQVNTTDKINEQFSTIDSDKKQTSLLISDIFEGTDSFMLACPYSGYTINESYNETIFRNNADIDESKNWFIIESQDRSFKKEGIDRTIVDFCGTEVENSLRQKFSEKIPGDTELIFERNSNEQHWVLKIINQ